MLQNIRKNLQGTIAKVIVALIIVPFALFGIESLLSGGGVQYVAEVDDRKISAMELQQQVNQQKRRLLNTMGDSIDPAMLDDQLLAGPALEFIIQKAVLMGAANDYGMAVSDQRLGEAIAEMEVFYSGGRFDPELYRRLVADQGYTAAGFQLALREDMIMTQLRAGLAGSEFVTPAELEMMAAINDERRDVRYLLMPLDSFVDEGALDEAAISDWYETNQERFKTPETVQLDYIELTVEDFLKPVDEDRLVAIYEEEKSTFQQPEERRVSHILFEQESGESDAELQGRIDAAVARLEDTDFAVLAEEVSADLGSAGIGGDLGYTAGETFPEEMEAAIAGLSLNEVSSVVQTDAGWHLIKLTEIREGEARSFEDVRPELEARLQRDEASRELLKAVESLRDLVFNAEDLAEPAAELGLEVERSEPVGRGEREGLFANRRLLDAAFSDEVLMEGFNSEVVEVEPEHFVVLRVREHTLPAVKPLESVREQVVAALADEMARRTIRDQANSLLSDLRDGASIEQLALANDYEWQVELGARRDNPGVPSSLLRRAFQLAAPEEGETTFDYVQNSDGDIELFELVRVTPGDAGRLNDAERRALETQMVNETGRRTDDYFQQQLRTSAEIDRS